VMMMLSFSIYTSQHKLFNVGCDSDILKFFVIIAFPLAINHSICLITP